MNCQRVLHIPHISTDINFVLVSIKSLQKLFLKRYSTLTRETQNYFEGLDRSLRADFINQMRIYLQ